MGGAGAPPRPVQIPTLQDLANGTPERVVRYLGQAEVDREEGGARFWTYSTGLCRLYLIFYEEPSGPYALHHLEMEAIGDITGSATERLQTCVGAVAAQFQSAGPAGPMVGS